MRLTIICLTQHIIFLDQMLLIRSKVSFDLFEISVSFKIALGQIVHEPALATLVREEAPV